MGWLVRGLEEAEGATYPTRFLHQFYLEFSALTARVSQAYWKNIQSQLGNFWIL